MTHVDLGTFLVTDGQYARSTKAVSIYCGLPARTACPSFAFLRLKT